MSKCQKSFLCKEDIGSLKVLDEAILVDMFVDKVVDKCQKKGGFVDKWGINSYYVMLKFASSTLMEERYPHIHKAHFYPPIDFRGKIRYTDEAHKNLGER